MTPTDKLCEFAKSLEDLSDKDVFSALHSEASKYYFGDMIFGKHPKKTAISKAYKVATGKELHMGL